ncbi:hypothetical protein MMC34_000481 [Xylographa carneopallida]|nr:hypothetical protein [Xylographa carneopallida]
MITRSSKLPRTLLPSLQLPRQGTRALHSSLPFPPIPQPTPFVPDPTTFLTLIGRQLSKHAPKITTWNSLFSLTSTQLRELGVEPARSRRYLLWWRDQFRRGIYGIGGDMQNVVDGVAEMRVKEVPVGETVKKVVVNTLPGVKEVAQGKVVQGFRVRGAGTIVGSYAELVKESGGSVARLKVQEGMWEVRRGHKVHGGERRRKYVLSQIAKKARGTLK